MLWAIIVALVILWALGFSLSIGGAFVHVLIVIALVLVIYDLLGRRRRA